MELGWLQQSPSQFVGFSFPVWRFYKLGIHGAFVLALGLVLFGVKN